MIKNIPSLRIASPASGYPELRIFNTGCQKSNTEQIRFLKIFISLLLILTMFFVASCELDNDIKELKADELRGLIDEGAQILIVDVRTEFEYKEGHIPKAINIPREQFNALEGLLPKDKAFPVVFYCRGYG